MNGLNACKRQNRTTGAGAMIAQSVADILSHHVKLSVEGIDRMYLNVYVPKLQHEQGIVWFFREHRGLPVPSAAVMSPMTGRPYPWIVRSTAMVNHYYVYAVDRDFGPFFLKFCSYFPFNAKLCLNGHEYAKRQLAQEGIAFEALDNGILKCADTKRLQTICNGLSAARIDALLRKWLRLLPHPFTPTDREAGYRYDISILQAEFSTTQVLDRPVHG